MAPCAETSTMTMAPERRQHLSDSLRRTRSLASLTLTTVVEDSTSTHSFSKDFDTICQRKDYGGWFNDASSDEFGVPDPFLSPVATVHYDCFGCALFEVEPDFTPTRVRSLPLLVDEPETNEKAVRRARRRRSSTKNEPQGHRPMRRRGSLGSSASSPCSDSGLSKPRSGLRRVKSSDVVKMKKIETAEEPENTEEMTGKMKRCRCSPGGGMDSSAPEATSTPLKHSGSKMRRSRSSGTVHLDLAPFSEASVSPAKHAGGKPRGGRRGSTRDSPSPKSSPVGPPKTPETRIKRSKSSGNGLNNTSTQTSNHRGRRRQSISEKQKGDASRDFMLLLATDISNPLDCSAADTVKSSRRRSSVRRSSLRRVSSIPSDHMLKGSGKDSEDTDTFTKKRRQSRRVSVDASAAFHTRN